MSQMEDCSASGSTSTVSEDGNLAVSSEDSSCPDDTELELGLGLSLGLKSSKNSRVLSAHSSLSSSLSRESVMKAGIKGATDSMAVTNSTGGVVGWPPIRTHRMNSIGNQGKPVKTEEMNTEIGKSVSKKDGFVKMKNSFFVKVNMDGIPIGRKVDLGTHKCYIALANTLEEMFLKPFTGLNATRSRTQERGEVAETSPSKLLGSSSGYVLTYEDKEGDWMLVGDIPWQMFLSSVRRLRIMRT